MRSAAAAPKSPARKKAQRSARRECATGVAHVQARSTTRSSPSQTRRGTSLRGERGSVGFKGSRKSTPFAAQTPRRSPHASHRVRLKQVEVS